MAFETVQYEVQDGIATIALNRPEVMNAISPQMLTDLNEALANAASDNSVGVIVITGVGRAFSAGVDLKALGDRKLDRGAVGPFLDDSARGFIDGIMSVPKVVIAKINGFCFTGALEIALACDLVYVAEEAKLGDTHAKWGLRPTWGMSQRLPRAVGLRKAMELSYTADTFTGKDAADLGLANAAVPLDELDAMVNDVAGRILANSRESIAAYKTLYREGMATTLKEGLEIERNSVFEISDTSDRLAAFMKKD